MSRITQRTIADTALRGLQGNLSRLQQLQNQLSSGKQVSVPSDDPSATVTAMTLRSRRAADEQYLRNVDVASGRLGVTDNSLTQLSDRLRAVRDLVVQSRNGALSAESQTALAANASAIGQEINDLYNTTYLDRPIFGGTIQGQTVLDASGTYLGNDLPVEARISADASLRIDVSGRAAGADTVPGIISSITTNMTAGTATDADLEAIDGALAQVARAYGDLGARAARVDQTKNLVDSHRLDLTSRISNAEDVDMPEAMMKLSAQQVGYQAALQSAAKIQQVSLVDFLK